MKKISTIIGDILESIGVYLFTLIGIFLAQYAPLLLKSEPVDTPFQWLRLALSAGVALYIVMTDEGTGDKEGKKANLKKRLAHSLTQGYMWAGLMGMAGQVAGQ